MQLTALGFDDWFRERSAPLLQEGQGLARVIAVDRGAFLVRDQDGESPAELAGKLRFGMASALDMPCVGDWVCVQRPASGGAAVIHSVVPRRTILRRKSPGRAIGYQLIAANIDIAFIVQACGYDFNLARLDRYMAMANEGGIEPWLILTKTDLIPPGALEQALEQVRQTRLSTHVLALSNTTGEGLPEFRKLLAPGGTYCLLGSSGVGKTTLVNRLFGHEAFDTRPVSGTGEGVHTTARRHLHILESGAMLVDTPGMREVGLLKAGDGVDHTFDDIHEHSAGCRFANCTHTAEPGCAVLLAVKNGTVSEERHQSFLKLKKEIAFHDLSPGEKRKKDRSFGSFIKSAKKSLKK
jgi:ribosome biogenesis GTPase